MLSFLRTASMCEKSFQLFSQLSSKMSTEAT